MYEPSGDVEASCLAPSAPVTVTVAPGTTAPVLSLTTPVTCPVDCANAGVVARRAVAAASRSLPMLDQNMCPSSVKASSKAGTLVNGRFVGRP